MTEDPEARLIPRIYQPGARTASGPHTSLAVALFALMWLGMAACGGSSDTAEQPVGHARMALSLPEASDIDHIDYTLTFTFLDANPPVTYNVEQYSSNIHGGELLAVLPCQTEPDGTGINRVDVIAEVFYRGHEDPVEVEKTAVFECVRNADTRVNIVLNIVSALDAGFADIDIAASGTRCAGKTDWLGDGFLGVCADSSCGDTEAVHLFANTCVTVNGDEDPIFWVCGAPSDWVISTSSANARFPVPAVDGSWEFGLIALDPLHMAQEDPTLTDDEGYLRVWTGVAFTHAVLNRQGGLPIRQDPETITLDFAAQLDVAPRALGQPSPQVLLLGLNLDEGAYISFQRRFGPCEVDVEGVNLYEDYKVLDVRLDGPYRARLLLEDVNYEFIMMGASCETGWTDDDRPIVTCGPPEPLSAAQDGAP